MDPNVEALQELCRIAAEKRNAAFHSDPDAARKLATREIALIIAGASPTQRFADCAPIEAIEKTAEWRMTHDLVFYAAVSQMNALLDEFIEAAKESMRRSWRRT